MHILPAQACRFHFMFLSTVGSLALLLSFKEWQDLGLSFLWQSPKNKSKDLSRFYSDIICDHFPLSLVHTGQEKAWVRRKLKPEHLVSLHDPLGLLCSVRRGIMRLDKGHRLVYNSGPNTELSAVWATEMAKTQPRPFGRSCLKHMSKSDSRRFGTGTL